MTLNPETPDLDVEALGRHGIKTLVMPVVGHVLMLTQRPSTACWKT